MCFTVYFIWFMCVHVLWHRQIIVLCCYFCLVLQEGQLEMNSVSLELIWDVYSLVTSRYSSRTWINLQRVNNAFYWRNHYPVDSYWRNKHTIVNWVVNYSGARGWFQERPGNFSVSKAIVKSRTLRLQSCFIHIFLKYEQRFSLYKTLQVYTLFSFLMLMNYKYFPFLSCTIGHNFGCLFTGE